MVEKLFEKAENWKHFHAPWDRNGFGDTENNTEKPKCSMTLAHCRGLPLETLWPDGFVSSRDLLVNPWLLKVTQIQSEASSAAKGTLTGLLNQFSTLGAADGP